ncbi:zinc finger CCCH domain-containing protein 36-like isoform X2 [Phoenix dactylifera]|uniref:Zinc finger CCCH domain-containing protein 36-like isoform X2 n=1 Tax=Phoenix dactylifera TaxID=42345 RepID=A0A8B7MSI3_PHODC|nr:zinc finger CCCH domain-containing protein 36-like isoform X2 [Phoenix dactylifera]
MPKRATPVPDSPPESSAMADCPSGSGGGDESPEEERDVDEEEEEVVVEEEDDEEGEEGSEGEGEEDEEGVEEEVAVEEEEGGAESPPGEDAQNASKKIESDGNGKDLKSVSSTHERSNIGQTLTIHGQDHVSDLTVYDPPAKLLAEDGKKASAINDRDPRSSVQDIHIMSSEENRFPKSHLADRDVEVLLEKETSTEASKDVRRYSFEAHGSYKSNLISGSLIGVEDSRLLHVNEDKLAVQSMIRSVSRCGKMDGVIEKDAPNPYPNIDWQPPEDAGILSMHTPQRRPRSSSPGAILEISGKRPAIVCDFFKKGWCIKGNSCSFLHLKEGDVSSSQWARENMTEPSLREEAQRLKLSSSHETLDSLNFEKSSKLNFQRALVRAYGGEGCGLTPLHDEYNKQSSKIATEEHFRFDISGSSRKLNLPMNDLRPASLVQEGYQRPIGVSTYLDTLDERRLANGEFLSRRYLDEGKLHQEMPKGEFLNNATFSSISPLSRNPLIPEYGNYSARSSAATCLYQNSNNPYSYGKMVEDVAVRSQQSRFPLPDPKYTSYSLSSSLNSSFDSSLQPLHGSPSFHLLPQIGASSTRGSAPLSAEHLESHRSFNFDRGYYGSRSASLPRKSSPYYSSSMQQGVVGDIPPPAGLKIKENSWEPSECFRSSYCAPPSKSSPGSQYDPLVDCIEHHKAGNVTSQTYPMTIIQSVSSQHIIGDPILSGHTPAYSSQKPLNSLNHSTEDIIDKNTAAHQFTGYITPVDAPGPDSIDGGNSFMSKDEKHWVPHATDGENVNEVDLDSNTGNQVDKARNDKESKALRIFRFALVDFVKELVKPFWRDGHFSKDAHKMIVKKAVEKVISSLQPHQIPSTAESINQYLSLSRTKIFKLVEGYMDKYARF